MKRIFLLLATVSFFWLSALWIANAYTLAPATSQTKDPRISTAFQQAHDYFQSWYDKIVNGDSTDKVDNWDASKAIEFFERGQDLMDKYHSSIDFGNEESTIFMAQLYTYLWIAYDRVANYEKAITIFNKWLALEGIDKLLEHKAYLINDIGYSLFQMGKYIESLWKYKEALKISPELDMAKRNIIFLALLEKSIVWMHENGLTRFTTPRTFRYEQELSREQASKFFVEFSKKYLNIPEKDSSCTFTDLKKSDQTLQSYIISACKIDIIRWSHGVFSPKDKLTYGQVVTLVSRMLDGTRFDNTTANFREDHMDNLYTKWILDDSDLETDADSVVKRADIATLLYHTYLYLVNAKDLPPAPDDSLGLTSPCADSGAIDQGILLTQVQDPAAFSHSLDYIYSGGEIYYQDVLLSHIDKQTFTVFDSFFWHDYALDQNHVYYEWEILTWADPKSFVVVDHPYCQYDAHHVYIDGEMASCTGEAIDQGISLLQIKAPLSNPSYVYSGGKIYYQFDRESSTVFVSGTDNQTFAVFDGGSYESQYALDKQHVYYQGRLLHWADSVSFVLSDWYDHDAYHIYRDGKMLFSCK